MKKIAPIIILLLITISFAFSKEAESQEARPFLKRIENNYENNWTKISDGKVAGFYNLNSKTAIEKLLFGDINAQIEFFGLPSFNDPYSFRITSDSINNLSILEVKRIANWDEVNAKIKKEMPLKDARLIPSISDQDRKQAVLQNRVIYDKRNEESLKLYTIETLSIPISNLFAEKLYTKFVSLIDGFKGAGKPAQILDGTKVTYRCVVGDDLWTLTIHEPRGDMRKLSDMCEQIIKEVEDGNLDESKYTKLLEK